VDSTNNLQQVNTPPQPKFGVVFLVLTLVSIALVVAFYLYTVFSALSYPDALREMSLSVFIFYLTIPALGTIIPFFRLWLFFSKNKKLAWLDIIYAIFGILFLCLSLTNFFSLGKPFFSFDNFLNIILLQLAVTMIVTGFLSLITHTNNHDNKVVPWYLLIIYDTLLIVCYYQYLSNFYYNSSLTIIDKFAEQPLTVFIPFLALLLLTFISFVVKIKNVYKLLIILLLAVLGYFYLGSIDSKNNAEFFIPIKSLSASQKIVPAVNNFVYFEGKKLYNVDLINHKSSIIAEFSQINYYNLLNEPGKYNEFGNVYALNPDGKIVAYTIGNRDYSCIKARHENTQRSGSIYDCKFTSTELILKDIGSNKIISSKAYPSNISTIIWQKDNSAFAFTSDASVIKNGTVVTNKDDLWSVITLKDFEVTNKLSTAQINNSDAWVKFSYPGLSLEDISFPSDSNNIYLKQIDTSVRGGNLSSNKIWFSQGLTMNLKTNKYIRIDNVHKTLGWLYNSEQFIEARNDPSTTDRWIYLYDTQGNCNKIVPWDKEN